MRNLLGILTIVALALAAPIVPFLLLGEGFEQTVAAWFDDRLSSSAFAGLVVGVLAIDILLPVPSSFVSTLAGARLGIVAGAAVTWLGMTVGAILGYALARWGGHPLVARLANADDLARMEVLARRWGPALVVMTRAVPILAEAAVLLVGATRLRWRRFLMPVVLANLGIALTYGAIGRLARDYDALVPALAASIALPLAAMLLFRLWMPVRRQPSESVPMSHE